MSQSTSSSSSSQRAVCPEPCTEDQSCDAIGTTKSGGSWCLPLDQCKIVVFIGSPAAGKTNAVKYIIYELAKHKVIHDILVVTASKFNNAYAECVPDNKIWPISGMKKREFMEEFDDYLEKRGRMRAKLGDKMKWAAIVFDDIYKQIDFTSPVWSKFLSQHRHYGLYVLFTSQYIKGAVATDMRSMANYAVLFESDSHETIKGMFEAFGSMYPKERDFRDRLHAATKEKYWSLLVCKEHKEIGTRFINWKADLCPAFKLKY